MLKHVKVYAACWLHGRHANSSQLLRNEQVFGKGPLFIDPLGFAPEAGIVRDLKYLFCGVFVAAFRPDRFSLKEFDRDLRRWNADRLSLFGKQMHLDAARIVIDSRHMSELTQVKIGIELAIDTGKQVEVKRSCYAQVVVIGMKQQRTWFFQVRSEKQGIARLENSSDCR